MMVSVRIDRADRIGRTPARLAAVAAVALSVAGCMSSDDYFDDGSAAAAMQDDQPLIHRLLTGSIIDPPRAKIEYTARSPLVVPPSTNDLPPPAPTGSATAKASVAWPKDPDEAQAALDAARARPDPAAVSKDSLRPGERLSPDEVQAGRIPGGGLNSASYSTTNSTSHNRMADRLTPEELAQKPAMPGSNNKIEISATPTRKYLIEPPTEYRKPATTAEMPEVKATADGSVADSNYDPKKSKLDNLVGNQ